METVQAPYYDIVKADNPVDLIRIVNKAIAEGWKPLGGMTPLYHPSETEMTPIGGRSFASLTLYYQTIFKEEL